MEKERKMEEQEGERKKDGGEGEKEKGLNRETKKGNGENQRELKRELIKKIQGQNKRIIGCLANRKNTSKKMRSI